MLNLNSINFKQSLNTKDKPAQKQPHYLAGSVSAGLGYGAYRGFKMVSDKIYEPVHNSVTNHNLKAAKIVSVDKTKAIAEEMTKSLKSTGFKYYLIESIEDLERRIPEQAKLFIKKQSSLKTVETQKIKIKNQHFIFQYLSKFLGMKQIKEKDILNGFGMFVGKSNIAVTSKRIHVLNLHEIGHGINYHLRKNKKILLKLNNLGRSISLYAAPLLLLFGLVYKKNENKENNPVTKTLDFVKQHLALLTFLTFTPKIIEESMASKRGYDFAKKTLKPNGEKLLNPNQLKLVKKCMINSPITYITGPLLMSLSIQGASEVKDLVFNKIKKDN